MFPLVALGIAFLGGSAAAVSMSQDAKSPDSAPAKGDVRTQISPQSYIVTPMDGGGGNSLSAVDAVRKFVV